LDVTDLNKASPPPQPVMHFYSGPPKQFLSGVDTGGHRAAAMYSLIETAKFNGLDPQLYLTDVLARIADHPARQISQLLPWH